MKTEIIITEEQFESQIKDLAVNYLGYTYYHTHRSQFSPSGWPDCVLARLEPTPRLVFAELKTDDLNNSQPSFEQYMWLYLLQHLGQEAYLWRPGDFDEIVRILKGKGNLYFCLRRNSEEEKGNEPRSIS